MVRIYKIPQPPRSKYCFRTAKECMQPCDNSRTICPFNFNTFSYSLIFRSIGNDDIARLHRLMRFDFYLVIKKRNMAIFHINNGRVFYQYISIMNIPK